MNGLTDKEVIVNRKKYGTNEITGVKKDTFYKLLLESLGDPIIRILYLKLIMPAQSGLKKDFREGRRSTERKGRGTIWPSLTAY